MSSAADAIRAVLQAEDRRPKGGGRMKGRVPGSVSRKGADLRKLYSAKLNSVEKDFLEVQLEHDIQSSLLPQTGVQFPIEQIQDRVKVVAGASFTDLQLRKLGQLFETNKDADFATRRTLAKEINTTEFQVRRWLENKKQDSKSVDMPNTAPKSRYFCSSESLSSSLGNLKALQQTIAASRHQRPQSKGTRTVRNMRKVEIPALSSMSEIQQKIDYMAVKGRRRSSVSGIVELINVEQDELKIPEVIDIEDEEDGLILKDKVDKTVLVSSTYEASCSRTSPVDGSIPAHGGVITEEHSYNSYAIKTELTECKRKFKELESKYEEKNKLVNELEVRIPKMIREFNKCLNDKDLALSVNESKIKELKTNVTDNEMVVKDKEVLLKIKETKNFNVEKELNGLKSANQDALTSLDKCRKEKTSLKSDLQKKTIDITNQAESFNQEVSKLTEAITKKDSELVHFKKKLRDLSKKDEEVRKLTQENKGLAKTILHMKVGDKESEKKDKLTIDQQKSKIKDLEYKVKKRDQELREKSSKEPRKLPNIVDGHLIYIGKLKSTIKVLEKEASNYKDKEGRMRLQLSDLECQGVTKSVELECVRNDVERLKKKLENQKECRKLSVVEATKNYIEKLKERRIDSDSSPAVKVRETTTRPGIATDTNDDVWIDDEDEGALVINLEDEQDSVIDDEYNKNTEDKEFVEIISSIKEAEKLLFPNPVKLLRGNFETEKISKPKVSNCFPTPHVEKEDVFLCSSFVGHVVTNIIHSTTEPNHLHEALNYHYDISVAGHTIGIESMNCSKFDTTMLSHINPENNKVKFDQVQISTNVPNNLITPSSSMFSHMISEHGNQELSVRKILCRSVAGRFGQKSWKDSDTRSNRRTVKRPASEDNCPIFIKMRRISNYDVKDDGDKFILSNLFITQTLNSEDNIPCGLISQVYLPTTNYHHISPFTLVSHKIVPVSTNVPHDTQPSLVSHKVILCNINHYETPGSLVSHQVVISTNNHYDTQASHVSQDVLSAINSYETPASLVSHQILPPSTNNRYDSPACFISHQCDAFRTPTELVILLAKTSPSVKRSDLQPIVFESRSVLKISSLSDFYCTLDSKLPNKDTKISPLTMKSHTVNLNLSLVNKPKPDTLTSDKDLGGNNDRKRKLSPSPPRSILESDHEITGKKVKHDCPGERSTFSIVTFKNSLEKYKTTASLRRSRNNHDNSGQVVKKCKMELEECSKGDRKEIVLKHNGISRSLAEIQDIEEESIERASNTNSVAKNENLIKSAGSTLIAHHRRLSGLCSKMPLVLYHRGNVKSNKKM